MKILGIDISPYLGTYAHSLLSGVASFLVLAAMAFLFRRILNSLMKALRFQQPVVQLVSQIAFYVFLVLAVIHGLAAAGVKIGALIAGLGLGGFALGFALRDAISNLLAGILVLVYRPFCIGQRITVAGYEGIVAEVNLRYTILEKDSSRYLVPNQLLFSNPIQVHDAGAEQ